MQFEIIQVDLLRIMWRLSIQYFHSTTTDVSENIKQ